MKFLSCLVQSSIRRLMMPGKHVLAPSRVELGGILRQFRGCMTHLCLAAWHLCRDVTQTESGASATDCCHFPASLHELRSSIHRSACIPSLQFCGSSHWTLTSRSCQKTPVAVKYVSLLRLRLRGVLSLCWLISEDFSSLAMLSSHTMVDKARFTDYCAIEWSVVVQPSAKTPEANQKPSYVLIRVLLSLLGCEVVLRVKHSFF